MEKTTAIEKRQYRVIVKNTDNEIVVCNLFECPEKALSCFNELLRRYSFYNKVVIDATLIY